MNDKKIDELLKAMRKLRKSLRNNPEAARKFLVGAGIIDQKGNYTEPYKHLCTPQEQA